MAEKTADGYLVEYNYRFYHITEAWCEEMRHHQINPRKATVDGRPVLADGEKEFNRLHYAVTHDGSPEDVEQRLIAFRDALTGNLKARRAHRLKPVTKDGDEDLRAVQNGEPVRPWNAAYTPDTTLHDWVRARAERPVDRSEDSTPPTQ